MVEKRPSISGGNWRNMLHVCGVGILETIPGDAVFGQIKLHENIKFS
jgi:hypothetical protein